MTNDDDRFWQAGATFLARDGVTRSTMMGMPCLRIRGEFFAAFNRSTGELMVKLPAARVEQLIADGEGEAVAPAGRRFREWAAIPPEDDEHWANYLAEAYAFVSGEHA